MGRVFQNATPNGPSFAFDGSRGYSGRGLRIRRLAQTSTARSARLREPFLAWVASRGVASTHVFAERAKACQIVSCFQPLPSLQPWITERRVLVASLPAWGDAWTVYVRVFVC